MGRTNQAHVHNVYSHSSHFERSRFDIPGSVVQLLRLVMIVALIVLYIASFYYQPFYVHYTHLTYWAMHFTLISLLLSFSAGGDKHNLVMREWALVTTEIALTLTSIAVLFYYGVVKDEMHQSYKGTTNKDWHNSYFPMFLTMLHLVPFTFTFINFVLSDIEFLKKDVAMIALVAVSYIVFNFLVSKLSGVPVYRFVTWHNLGSFVSALLFILAVCAVYMVLVMLSAILPRKENAPYVQD